MARWFRLCVDITSIGQILGASYERHVDGELDTLWVSGARIEESPSECFDWLLGQVEQREGVQLELWP